MKMKIYSIKCEEFFHGELEDAISRAKKIDEEYQPAYGVQIEDESGNILWDSEDN